MAKTSVNSIATTKVNGIDVAIFNYVLDSLKMRRNDVNDSY